MDEVRRFAFFPKNRPPRNTVLQRDKEARKTAKEKLGLAAKENLDFSADTGKVNKVCVPIADRSIKPGPEKCPERLTCDPELSIVRRPKAMSRTQLIVAEKDARGYKHKHVPVRGVAGGEEDPEEEGGDHGEEEGASALSMGKKATNHDEEL